MKNIPTSFQNHLDGGVTTLCTLWKVTRKDGVVLGFTEHDSDLTFQGFLYKASSGITASRISQSLGLSVDNLNLQGALDSNDISESDIELGLYDDAEVILYRVNWKDLTQFSVMSRGSLGEIKRTEIGFEAEFRSLSHNFNQKLGRIYQRTCDHKLGDSGCKVDLTNPLFRGLGVVQLADSRELDVTGLESFEDGWFTHGLLTFTSGNNLGRSLEIKAHNGNRLTSWEVPAFIPLNGDTFYITSGCRQSPKACRDKFNNFKNYGGFPYIPGSDSLNSYPNQDSPELQGGSLFPYGVFDD